MVGVSEEGVHCGVLAREILWSVSKGAKVFDPPPSPSPSIDRKMFRIRCLLFLNLSPIARSTFLCIVQPSPWPRVTPSGQWRLEATGLVGRVEGPSGPTSPGG
jgi:hypothetical protein